MPRYPAFPVEVALVPVTEKGLYALRGDEGYFLPETRFDQLWQLVDGTRSYQELRQRCADPQTSAIFSSLLRKLVARNLLEEFDQPLPPPPPEEERLDRLRRYLSTESLREAFPGGIHDLRGNGTGSIPRVLHPPRDEKAEPALLMVDDTTDPRIEPFAQSRSLGGRSWILFQPHGWCPVVGPCFRPGWPTWPDFVSSRQGVAETLFLLRRLTGQNIFLPLRRRTSVRVDEMLIRELINFTGIIPNQPSPPPFRTFPSPDHQPRHHQFPPTAELNPRSQQPTYQERLRQPCPLPSAEPWQNGRNLSLAEVESRLSVFCDPYLGPIEKVDVQPLQPEASPPHYAALAWHRQRDLEPTWDILWEERLCPSGGHGPTPGSARGAALGEAMERISTHLRGEEPLIYSRRPDLPGRAFSPPELEHFSAGQISPPNALRTGWEAVSAPWSEDRSIPWIQGWSLSKREPVFLPAAYVYYGWPENEQPAAICTSNGVASGASEAEAFFHGLLELIERDAVALWWYQRVPRPTIKTVIPELSPWVSAAERTLADCHRTLEVLDLTHDLGIPVVAAISMGSPKGPLLYGFGCHLDPAKALQKAIGEVLYRATASLETASDPLNLHLSQGHPVPPYLRAFPDAAASPMVRDYPGPTESWDRLIHWLIDHFQQKNMEIITVRLTRPAYQWPVVRVVVPPLHHFWPRFGSSRLYQLPTAWQIACPQAAKDPDGLNPIPQIL